MKKILFTLESLKKGGGAETVISTIGNELYKKGYEIHYITFYNEKNSISIKGNKKCLNEKRTRNILIRIVKLFLRAYKIYQYCKKSNIDVSISAMEPANIPNIISKILFGNKSKIFIEIFSSLNKSLNYISFIFYKIIIIFSDKVISQTKEDIKNYKKYFKVINDKIINIYNPVDIIKINNLKNRKINNLNIGEKDFIFTNIGRLINIKNHELLIKAFNLFNKKYPNSKLLILGEGKLEEHLKNITNKLNNKNNILFLGRKENPYKYLNISDYFIMTSNYEGLPVSQVESLICNIPIISTDCETGPREIIFLKNTSFDRKNKVEIGDCGILTPVGNITKLIEAMEIAYNNKNNLTNTFKNNIKIKIKEFDINNIIKVRTNIIEN